MRKALNILFLLSLLSFAVLLSLQDPLNLIIFVPLFAMIYVIIPLAIFYVKRAVAVRKLKAACADGTVVFEKKTLRRQKYLILVRGEKRYLITMISAFRPYLNLVIKSESEICFERFSSPTKIYAVQPNKWGHPYPHVVLPHSVDGFPESNKKKQKILQSCLEDSGNGYQDIRIWLVCPPMQNVFYLTKNFNTDYLYEPAYDGCRIGRAEIYTPEGFYKHLINI